MEQPQKDAAIRVAWITGAFALAGTLITVLFTSGSATKDEVHPPETTNVSTTLSTPPPTTAVSPSTGTETATTAASPTPLVPRELVGNWYGGPQGQANIHLRIADSADYVLWDVNIPNSTTTGKVGVQGAIVDFYGNDGSVRRYPWSIEGTPRGDVLDLGVYRYLRE